MREQTPLNSYETTRQATHQKVSAVILRQGKKGAKVTVEKLGKMKVEMTWTCDRYGEEYKRIQCFGEGTRRKETIPNT
jgi:hypothetical protein